VGNGDPNCHEPEKGNRRSLFNGLAQVIVQSQSGGSDKIILRAKADGLKSTETKIQINAVAPRPFILQCDPVLVLQIWRMSPVSDSAPDPNVEVSDSDMNTWVTSLPGELQSFAGGRWAIYRIRFTPFAAIQTGGGQLVCKSITGKAEVWLDKILLGKKETFIATPFTVAIPPGEGERTLSVLIETTPGKPAGFGGAVSVEAGL
jgi:beta-galactosidase